MYSCKWCPPVGAVCGCRRCPASKHISPDPAVSARALTRGEQLHVSILTETEDFTVCTLCQSPKPLLLRSLVPCTASQTSNINASIASQPVLLPTIDSSFCWEAPVCLLPWRDWCRLQTGPGPVLSRVGTFCRRRPASAQAQTRRTRRREKLFLLCMYGTSFLLSAFSQHGQRQLWSGYLTSFICFYSLNHACSAFVSVQFLYKTLVLCESQFLPPSDSP